MASLLYGLAGKLLGELCSPVFNDYVGKPWELGIKSEFEKLKNTLSAVEAVLLDAEEKQRTNNQVQDWLAKIKLVFYDIEDLLHELTTEASKRLVMTKNKKAKEVHLFFSSSNQVMYRLKMGRKVKFIRERLDAIALDSHRFSFIQRPEEIKRRMESHSFVPLEKVIGREDDIENVTKMLLRSDGVDNVSVVSIVGMGGLGKTTLAQSVYNSHQVKGGFEVKMWVCVSDPFDVKLICEKIVESATGKKCERIQMEGVKDELKEAIDGRKYLLVLDDVWNESPVEWEKLEELLAGGMKGSKILITTRAELVSRAANSIATHFLKGLSREESWAFFKQVAFKRGVEPDSAAVLGIGKEVVEICGGVPLAIKMIGSMLGLKASESKWLDFKKNDLPMITQDREGHIVPILKLSYDYLSANLKRCFIYCSIFPKDDRIQKETLIRMWIAHGFIQLDGTTRSLEDVGEQCLMNLSERSFFQVYVDEENSGSYFYKMHDLIHDLALSIGGNEYCFDVNKINETTRHARIPLSMGSHLLLAKKLRTLVVRDSLAQLDRRTTKEVKNVFKRMRVLDLSSYRMKQVPDFVNGLRNLNYLDLSHNTFDSLSESITRLYSLQTLNLAWCSNLKELPPETRNLVNLRHLDINGCYELNHMPRGMEELTCLQTLTNFVTEPEGSRDCGKLRELESLVNLRGGLIITNLRRSNVVKGEGRSRFPLSKLTSIQYLELTWKAEFGEVKEEEEAELLSLFESLKPHSNLEKLTIRCYGGTRFPSWMDTVNIGVCLPNIVKIEAYGCWNLVNLPLFGLLPCLRELGLSGMPGTQYLYEDKVEEEAGFNSCNYSPNVRDQHFPSLRSLSLGSMPVIKGLVGPTAAAQKVNCEDRERTEVVVYFPVLEKLCISGCPMFGCDGRDNLNTLRDVNLSNFTGTVVPGWLQYVPQLHTLELSYCDIVSLPEWMGNLTSLNEIRLESCDSLESIPSCIRCLTSLQRLKVADCAKIFGRCKKETGEDWPNIAHIPNIQLKKWLL